MKSFLAWSQFTLAISLLFSSHSLQAASLTSEWQGEWGSLKKNPDYKTESELNPYSGAIVTIKNCEPNSPVCLFDLYVSDAKNNNCEWRAKVIITSPTTAIASTYNLINSTEKCYFNLALSGSGNSATLHLLSRTGDKCADFCSTTTAVPLASPLKYSDTFPLQSHANYPDDNLSMPPYKEACFADNSKARKIICTDPEMHTLDAQARKKSNDKLNVALKNFKVLDEWRDKTITECNSNPDPKNCLTTAYYTQYPDIDKIAIKINYAKTADLDPLSSTYISLITPGDSTAANKLITQYEGVYKNLNPEEKENVLEIVRASNDKIYFSMVMPVDDKVACRIHGIAFYNKNGDFLFDDHASNTEQKKCFIKITPSEKGILLNSVGEYCGDYCWDQTDALTSKTPQFLLDQRHPIDYMSTLIESADYKEAMLELNDARFPPAANALPGAQPAHDAAPKTAQPTPGAAQPLQTQAPNVAKPVQTQTPEVAQPVQTQTPKAAQPVQAQTPKAAQPVQAQTPKAAQPVQAQTPKAAQPVQAQTPKAAQPVQAQTPKAAQPVQAQVPKTAESPQITTPKTTSPSQATTQETSQATQSALPTFRSS